MTTSYIEISATFPGEDGSTPGVWCPLQRRFIPRTPDTWMQWVGHIDEAQCDAEHVVAVQCTRSYVVLTDGQKTPA